jgi:hypothetical protein
MIDNKKLVNNVIDALSEDGIFNNPFIDKEKCKLLLSDNILKSENPIYELEYIIQRTLEECVTNEIDNTLETLIEYDLVETVITENGEIAYRLKQ